MDETHSLTSGDLYRENPKGQGRAGDYWKRENAPYAAHFPDPEEGPNKVEQVLILLAAFALTFAMLCEFRTF